MGSKKNMVTDCLLAKVNFPLYAAEMLTSRHLLVAGGGGSAKTGVANGFEIYELYHNGKYFVAEEIQRHETGSRAVMNMSLKHVDRRALLVAGQEGHSQMFVITSKVGQQLPAKEIPQSSSNNRRESSSEMRQRRRTESTSQDTPKSQTTAAGRSNNEDTSSSSSSANQMKRVYFDIKAADTIQTDFSAEPYQRVVRISMNGKFMATGGIDGHVRVWNFPQMTPFHDIKAHEKELDDIDFSPDGKSIVSIAKDGIAAVWSVSTGKEALRLKWTPPENVKYLYKRCRYGTIEGSADKYRLFTISNPLQKAGKQRGFLQQWNIETGRLNNIVSIDESLSALAIRDDGRFVSVGTMFTGSVMIYIAFSLQQVLYVPNAHSMFVTGLEFVPVLNKDAPPISSDSEASVISYSVDNRICIHSLQYRHTLPAWAAIFLIVVILFLTFLMCSYFGI